MEHFSYEGGCGVNVSRYLRKDGFNGLSVMVHCLKQYATKELKNEAVVSFKTIFYALLCGPYHALCNCGIQFSVCLTVELYSGAER